MTQEQLEEEVNRDLQRVDTMYTNDINLFDGLSGLSPIPIQEFEE